MIKIDNIPKGKILLAISGGIDSIVLLDLLQKKKTDIVLAHLNHNTRGEESDSDENFVKDLAKKYNVKIHTHKLKIKPKNEEDAREKRYEFLFRIKDKIKANYIALAQHKSDHIETLLLKLIRGTNTFSTMKEFSKDCKWRPLLKYSKEEIYEYAKKNKLKWREDSTNKNNSFSRNRIRNLILPEIFKINPNFSQSLIKFAISTEDNAKFIEQIALEFINKYHFNEEIERQEFIKLDHVIQKTIIKILAPKLYAKHIDEIFTMINKGIGNKKKHNAKLTKGMIKFNIFE